MSLLKSALFRPRSFPSPFSCPIRLQQRLYATVHIQNPRLRDRPVFRAFTRFISFTTLCVTFTIAGFAMGLSPVGQGFQNKGLFAKPPSDEETLHMFIPSDEESQEIEDYINNHPITQALRSNPDFTESRPHLKVPEDLRPRNLTAGTLAGPGRIAVPPFTWSEKGGKSFVSISYLGTDLCGHPGIIHGGLLATMLDEGLARCCFPALPNKIGVTANLSVTYKKPTPAGSFVVLRAQTVNVEGRKAFVKGHIETLPKDGEEPVVLVEAQGLFVEPRYVKHLAAALPVPT